MVLRAPAVISFVLLALALTAALATACSSGGVPSSAPRPIDDILAGPIEIADLTASSGVVRVDTTTEVMCSVVYGTDESYGSQSTDPDMGGVPHKEHAAPLRGLQPDTVYHYRLQGTGSDGTLYVSEDLTFHTPPAAGGADDYGENVAALAAGARVAEVSSVFGDSDTWAAGNAIDGDPSTEWSSQGDGDGAFITIGLAERHDLTAVGFWTRTMGNSAQITRFQVVVDGDTVLGPFDLPDATQMHLFPVSASAEQLRFEVIASSGGNTGAVEVAAFSDE